VSEHVPARQFDAAYCANSARTEQDDMARLAFNVSAVAQSSIDNTYSHRHRAAKRKQLLNYVRLTRRASLGKPLAGHNPQDYLDAFEKMQDADDGRLSHRQASPPATDSDLESPTDLEFMRSLPRKRVRSRASATTIANTRRKL
jgi:hypothetical protein